MRKTLAAAALMAATFGGLAAGAGLASADEASYASAEGDLIGGLLEEALSGGGVGGLLGSLLNS
ncbi:hypothetical protein ACFQV2_11710 [Actinokineospora soli]|uniref:Secreted protein n=1 Tax=Actinokineospora soli TaxID=1048753 RepID=A0ABW2TK61_9PSEU